MTSAVDQKTFWGLGEMVMWIRTRDHERVVALSDLSELEAMVQAMFAFKPRFDPGSLTRFSGADCNAGCVATAPQSGRQSSDIDEPVMMGWGEAVDDLFRKVHSRRVLMTAIRWGGSSNGQVQVPPAELNDLAFRLLPDYRVAPVGLWSRSLDTLCWRSPQFLRANGICEWPAQSTKTVAVSRAILRHLREIMTAEAPLTKLAAQQRCMTEVPNAYPGAFKKAWGELEPSCKRGRGKRGPRAH
jgi:hypothetical protein